ncbi:Retrovirus-related Pol polyprotein from transposon RE1 [Bienertia sinuspersici]
MHNPRVPHLKAALHVLKYLKGTIDVGLYYKTDSDLQLHAFSDVDFSSYQFSSRSLSSYVIFLGQNLVSWKTKKQSTVSQSSAEVEYRSLSATAREVVWVEGLLQDLSVQVQLPITVYCDNTSAELLAHNPKVQEKTKHLKRHMHYIREQVEEGFLQTTHVSSSEQLADLLTNHWLPINMLISTTSLVLFPDYSWRRYKDNTLYNNIRSCIFFLTYNNLCKEIL